MGPRKLDLPRKADKNAVYENKKHLLHILPQTPKKQSYEAVIPLFMELLLLCLLFYSKGLPVVLLKIKRKQHALLLDSFEKS